MLGRWCTRFLYLWGALLLTASAAAEDDFEASSEWDAVMMMSMPRAPEAEQERSKESRSKKRGKGHKKPAKRKGTTDAYARLRESWHAPIEDGSWGTLAEAGEVLVLRSLGRAEPVVLTPESEAGGFGEDDIYLASQFLGTWKDGPSVHPRLLDLIYQAVRHFGVPYVTVVSGIRRDRKGSRHSHGLAADIVLPGVDDEALAAFFRPKGFVGVGTYPRGGFVHIDVREQSFFWVDRSPPGTKRSRVHQVRAAEAKAADEAALARGERPLENPEALRKALRARATRRNKVAQRKEQAVEGSSKKRRAGGEERATVNAAEGANVERDKTATPAKRPRREGTPTPATKKHVSEAKRRERS